MHSQSFSIRDIAIALTEGRLAFRAMPGPSAAYTAVFAVIGLVLMIAVGVLGVSPLVLPLVGGFLLVGPAFLSGFFELVRILRSGRSPRATDAFRGFAGAAAGVWAVAGFCAFLLLIWITDVGVLYSFMIGAEPLPYELPWLIKPSQEVVAFELWAALMGAILAFATFAVTAFSVPLLYERRAGPVEAISSSVRTVFANPVPSLAWSVVLAAATMFAILLPPLLLVVLPILAYASFALYQRVFPSDDGDAPRAPGDLEAL